MAPVRPQYLKNDTTYNRYQIQKHTTSFEYMQERAVPERSPTTPPTAIEGELNHRLKHTYIIVSPWSNLPFFTEVGPHPIGDFIVNKTHYSTKDSPVYISLK